MKKNISRNCRIARSLLGLSVIAIALWPLKGLQGETLGIVGIVLGAVIMLVAMIGVCPVFIPLGIDQTKQEKS